MSLTFPELPIEATRPAPPGRVSIGSSRHKDVFCRALFAIIDPYKPAVIDWPALAPKPRDRLMSLPI